MPPAARLIVLIDDSAEDRAICRRLLRQAQPGAFTFAEATTIEEGLAVLQACVPWCVLVDYYLPDAYGITLVERLRALDSAPPVVMLTGMGDERIATEALKQGVQDYLPKRDLDATLLYRVVEGAVQKHALQRLVAQHQRETQEANERLRALNATLAQHVAVRTEELTHTNAELERAHAALQQRNQELQEFAYVASHDLQEPLRKIRTFASLLLSEHSAALPEEARHFTERMSDAASRMSVLLNDLLMYSRVSKPSPEVVPVDLNTVAAEVLRDLELAIREAGAVIEVGHLCTVEGAPSRMRQIFQNLIANAVKFRREGVEPVIHITAARVEDEATPSCRIWVKDNGIGFDGKYLDRIFSPFQRLHGNASYAGTGMGLAICRRLTQQYHGRLTAQSVPGEGATFELTLPLRQPTTPNGRAVAHTAA